MEDIILKIEAMYKLGLLSEEEAKSFTKAYKSGGDTGLKTYITDYALTEEKKRQLEEKKLAAETKALIREDKLLLQKFRKSVKTEVSKRSKDRVKSYRAFQKMNDLKRKKIEVEMSAADRKIDEIIAEATKNIEAEITQKIREKLI